MAMFDFNVHRLKNPSFDEMQMAIAGLEFRAQQVIAQPAIDERQGTVIVIYFAGITCIQDGMTHALLPLEPFNAEVNPYPIEK